MATMAIFIQANSVREIARGVFEIELPGVPMTLETHLKIRELFPNMMDKAYELMDKERLLSMIITTEEADAIRTKVEKVKSEAKEMSKKAGY